MADFEPCFYKVKDELEGGDKLIHNHVDRGGMTYAGISRLKNPNCDIWPIIDQKDFDSPLLPIKVKSFYKREFWDKIQGDVIGAQSIAYNLFEFGVNAGISTAIKLCQKIINVTPDGVFGNNTLKTLNAFVQDSKDEQIFVLKFSLMKVFRYKTIVMNDARRKDDLLLSDQKFLCGWINRVQSGLAYWGLKYP